MSVAGESMDLLTIGEWRSGSSVPSSPLPTPSPGSALPYLPPFLSLTSRRPQDLFFDWSLGRRGSKHLFLRPELGFKDYAWVYYVSVVVDVCLRLTWIIYIPTQIYPSVQLRGFIVALLEVFRRILWNTFRSVPFPFVPSSLTDELRWTESNLNTSETSMDTESPATFLFPISSHFRTTTPLPMSESKGRRRGNESTPSSITSIKGSSMISFLSVLYVFRISEEDGGGR